MPDRLFIVPRESYYGPGAVKRLANLPGERAFIVTDPGVRDSGLLERVEKILHEKKAQTKAFDQVEHDPDIKIVREAFSVAQDFKPDVIIGLGGGSSMDCGKAAWAFYEHPDLATAPLREMYMKFATREMRKKARYIAIPTTSGTGSEVTRVAIISDHDAKPPYKGGIGSQQLAPDVALVDPELTLSMPPRVTANSGFDALIHAIECYVLTSPPSDLVDAYALWAAKTVWEWLPKAVADGKNIQNRDKMHLAAFQAGIAFSNGNLGVIHSTGHEIGAVFNIPHGAACFLMLCPSFAYLYPTHKARLSSLATALGVTGQGDKAKVSNLLKALDQLAQKVGVPLSLKEAGVKEADYKAIIDTVAERTASMPARLPPERQRIRMTPWEADKAKELYTHAWNGTRAELKEQAS